MLRRVSAAIAGGRPEGASKLGGVFGAVKAAGRFKALRTLSRFRWHLFLCHGELDDAMHALFCVLKLRGVKAWHNVALPLEERAASPLHSLLKQRLITAEEFAQVERFSCVPAHPHFAIHERFQREPARVAASLQLMHMDYKTYSGV